MTPQPQQHLDIRERPNGHLVIKRYPFETVFNVDEVKELEIYFRSRPHASTPKFAKDCMCNKYANCTDCQQHDTAIRNATLDGIIKAINEDIEYEDYCIKTFDTQINRTQKAILSQVVEKIESIRIEP